MSTALSWCGKTLSVSMLEWCGCMSTTLCCVLRSYGFGLQAGGDKKEEETQLRVERKFEASWPCGKIPNPNHRDYTSVNLEFVWSRVLNPKYTEH